MNALAPALLFVLAFAIRCLPWPYVLRSERIYLHGNDAYYHLRRILYTLNDFPSRLDFDPYINFPHGARAIWPPLYDFAAALVLLPFHDPGNPRAVETAAVFLPPLLGASTVVVLFLLARRHFGNAVAWAAGLSLCVLSAHFHYSRIGFVDHHAAVALAATLLLSSTLNLLATFDE
jgi:asparagine N-glycosylation enzyme membrane subunit Stt3